jgi:hypothetical protein
MARVIGHDLRQYHNELSDKVRLQEKLIDELVKLNENYEVEVKRLVDEYNKLYELHLGMGELLKHYDPAQFGYPKHVDKEVMEKVAKRRDIPGVEFIDFSKPKTND